MFCKGKEPWNAKKRKISINVIVLMNHPMKEIFAGKKEENKLMVGKELSQIKNKNILILFILLIFAFVGVRIWAEKEINDVPLPNFISASERGVAVSWGQTIYLLDHEGRVTGKETIELTQIKFVDGELWIADYNSKSIYKLKDNELTRIIDAANLIRSTFKFVFNKAGDKIYITDSTNHRVHIFDKQGKFERSFGKEGKAPGELKFPNSIVLTEDGNFLIVNTNAFRLDIYSPEGEFIKTFAEVKGIGKKADPRRDARELLLHGEAAVGRYEWPTILTQCGDKVVFLLAKNGLIYSKAVVYDREGKFVGELIPPYPFEEASDLASWGNMAAVTDKEARKIHLFNVDNMYYAGEFSSELDKKGNEDTKKANEYRLISRVSLAILLFLALPVFILLIRQRRKEAKDIDAIDIKSLVPSDAIWAVQEDKIKMAIAMILIVLNPFIIIIDIFLKDKKIISPLVNLIILMIIVLVIHYSIKLMMDSGYLIIARRRIIEKMLKTVSPKLRDVLGPEETVVGCTVLQTQRIAVKFTLFVLTNRQLLLFEIVGTAWRFTLADFSRYGYGNVKKVSVEQATKTSRFMKPATSLNKLVLSVDDGTGTKELTFYLLRKQILEKIKTFLEEKRLQGDFIETRVVNENTFKAIHPGWRGKKIPEKWIAPILSAIFPGLGQFYNRQILKGTGFCAVFLFFIFILIYPLRTIVEKSAEYNLKDLLAVVSMIVVLLMFYYINIADAYSNTKKESL
jgi:hypothetical protein